MKQAAYFTFSMIWLGEVYALSNHWRVFFETELPWLILYLVLWALGTVTIAHTISFYNVGAWLRAPLTQVNRDSAGAIESVDPKPGLHPFLEVLAELICCPICAGTHGATLMLLVYALNPHFGFFLALAAAGSTVSMLLHWHSEKIQHEGRLAIEQHGALWLRKVYPYGDDLYRASQAYVSGEAPEAYFTALEERLGISLDRD